MTGSTSSKPSNPPVVNAAIEKEDQDAFRWIVDVFAGAIGCALFGFYYVNLAGQGEIRVVPLERWPITFFCFLIGFFAGAFIRYVVRHSMLFAVIAQVMVVSVSVSVYLSKVYEPMGTAGEYVVSPLSWPNTFLLSLLSITALLVIVKLIRIFIRKIILHM